MQRYIRFGYLIPRLLLLLVLYFGIEWGANYALYTSVVDGGQQSLGARVELDSAKVSLWEARAELKGFKAANPQRPMENLVEADRVQIDFDMDGLLRRTLVAEQGEVRGLRFGTPRETSGVLTEEEQTETTGVGAPAWITSGAEQKAKRWLDQIEGRLTGDLAQEFQSVRLAEEMSARWPARYAELRELSRQLQEDAKRLEVDVREARTNPLRNAELIRSLPQRIDSLRGQLAQLQQELAAMPVELEADRARIAEARASDEALLRRQLTSNQLDPESLTSYLLGEEVTRPVAELISWVRWTRSMMPANGRPARTVDRARGEDVRFVGQRPRPNLLIRALDLEGVAQVAGQPVELLGRITDFTTQPELHAVPMRVSLQTQGQLPMEIQVTLDRTGSQAIDELAVDCNTLHLPGMQLGSDARLRVGVGPTQGNLAIRLRIEGDNLAGRARLVQHDIRLQPEIATGSTLARRVAGVVTESIGQLSEATTHIELSGTLDQPRAAIDSSLGKQLAKSLRGAVDQVIRNESERVISSARGEVESQLAGLTEEFNRLNASITEEIAAPSQIVNNLAGATFGRGTFSFEQLGKQLPAAGSIFR